VIGTNNGYLSLGEILLKSLNYALNWPQSHPCEITNNNFKREGPEINDIGWHINKHDWGNQIIKKKQTYLFAEWVSHLWDEKVEC